MENACVGMKGGSRLLQIRDLNRGDCHAAVGRPPPGAPGCESRSARSNPWQGRNRSEALHVPERTTGGLAPTRSQALDERSIIESVLLE